LIGLPRSGRRRLAGLPALGPPKVHVLFTLAQVAELAKGHELTLLPIDDLDLEVDKVPEQKVRTYDQDS
jgi:hypothetical protein